MRTTTLLVAALVVLSGCSFLGGDAATDGSPAVADATDGPTATPGASPTATPSPTPSPSATPTATPTAASTPAPTPTPAAERDLPDPPSDRLGWENGYWYNESVSVDRSDGLNGTELDAVVARGMARVEQIRELEFEETPPVEVISRAEYRQRLGDLTGETTTADRLHQNAKWEATFMVNETTDAIAVQEGNLAGGTLGLYDPRSGEILIISDDTETPQMNEITLAQELFHALQDQRFNTSGYDQRTRELHNARDGIIEGDGNYVDYLYEQRCDEEWDCLRPEGGPGGSADIHIGLWMVSYVPYSEGPEFVRDIHEARGWTAVNEVYENPPASTEQIIHHDAYPDEVPANVTVEDSASDGWRVLDLPGGIDYAAFGEGGLYSMFWYASYEESQATGAIANVVVPYQNFLNFREGSTELRAIGPYNYAHEVTAGWDGDRLVPYVNDTSAETNETGYVWETAWDTEADAREFLNAYERLLEYRGAEPVDGHEDTYRIPAGDEFDDAFYVTRDGTEVVVVNAPSVAALSDVRAGAAPESDGGA